MSKGGTTTSTSSIDPQIKEAFLANFQQAQGVAGALPVQQFAGYNPMYQAGEEALVNTALAGPGITGTDLAAQMAAYGGVYQPAQIQAVRTNLGLGGQMAMPQMAMPQMAMPQSVNRAPKTEADWNMFQQMAQFAPGTDMAAAKTEFMGVKAFGGPEMGAYSPASSLVQQNDPFYQSPEYKQFQSESEDSIGTMDMYDSPNFGSIGSGTTGRAMDEAYGKYKAGLQSQVMPQQGGFGGQQQGQMPQAQQMQMPQAQQIGSIGSYMNPYSELVRKNALADLESSRQMAVQQMGERANAARAFGGSRQGVAESLTNLGFAKQAGNLGATLNEQAFNQAMAAQQADIGRQSAADIANQQAGLQGAQLRLGGASQLGNLAAQQQALRLGGAQAVMGAGGARQAFDQQQADAIRNIGLQRLGIVQSSLGAQPANLGMASSTPYTQNVGAGLLGGALAGSQLAGVAGLTAGTGAGLGALAALI